jgi:hypothetical protein
LGVPAGSQCIGPAESVVGPVTPRCQGAGAVARNRGCLLDPQVGNRRYVVSNAGNGGVSK